MCPVLFSNLKPTNMGMLKEFREFAMKGSIVDLAVAVVIGAAFGAIVSSLVDDIIMPIVNPLLPAGGWQAWTVGSLKIGNFLGAVVKFIIIAFALFLVIKTMNRFMKKKEAAPPPPAGPSSTDKLLME